MSSETSGRPDRSADRRIEVRDGTTLVVDVLRWNEGWEFDCPVCVLRPVVRFSPNGDHADALVEALCFDAAMDGYVESESTASGVVDRQYPIKTLRRRWSEARGGKQFPVKCYTASRFRVRFFDDADGLAFDVQELGAQ